MQARWLILDTNTHRRMLEVQARQLWRFVCGEAVAYHGFTTGRGASRIANSQ